MTVSTVDAGKKLAKKVERKKTIVKKAKQQQQQQQQQNKPPHRPSKYVGLCWNKQNKKWEAAIRVDGKKMFLWLFPD